MTQGRTEKNSLLCPNCRKLVSADEPFCPYCGLVKPGSRWRTLSGRFPVDSVNAVKILICVNVAYFIFSLILNPRAMTFSMNPLMFLSPSENSLFVLGATGTVPIAGFHRWWTLITASFLHGGILHIFFNMAALAQLGMFVLAEFGFSRFTIIYLVSGVVGFYLSYLAGIPFTIGASASICGLIGAILYYGKSRGGFYGQAIYRQALGWIVGLALFGLLVPGINNWAHGGGLTSGILLSFLMGYQEKKPESFLNHALAIAVVAITGLVLLWTCIVAAYLAFS